MALPRIRFFDTPVPQSSRRRFLAGMLASVTFSHLPGSALAQDSAMPVGTEFSFDWLSEKMKAAAASRPPEPEEIKGFLSTLNYDEYNRIRFAPDRTRWAEQDNFRLNAFHMGWLFKEPVHIYEVTDGTALPMDFGSQDFLYGFEREVPEFTMPGVAGIRLMAPFNRSDKFDEVVAFLGASYFRALGQHNRYGLSARGLAVNTGLSQGEEFPRFSDLWLERPGPEDDSVTLYAALESRSVTGAYRFVITPGETTTMDVTARLYLRRDIEQLGIAPLTSMFLFGGADPGAFDDFREAVHDSESLILNTAAGETFVRALNNPPRLANSYLGVENPRSFGLIQRTRGFDNYLDAQAHYELRPSLIVEPLGDWGKGSVRLVEIPTDLEVNDNIVAYWTPDQKTNAGDALEYSYRLHWGLDPQGDRSSQRAQILRTRVGEGGVAGVEGKVNRRKFVIDFAGGPLAEPTAPEDVQATVNSGEKPPTLDHDVRISGGEIKEVVLSQIDNSATWRLVIEATAEEDTVAELRARLVMGDQTVSETWLYQWVK
jgi:glucans biosynthesis protein